MSENSKHIERNMEISIMRNFYNNLNLNILPERVISGEVNAESFRNTIAYAHNVLGLYGLRSDRLIMMSYDSYMKLKEQISTYSSVYYKSINIETTELEETFMGWHIVPTEHVVDEKIYFIGDRQKTIRHMNDGYVILNTKVNKK